MVEAKQLDIFPEPEPIKPRPPITEKKKLTPEQKKNIQWFWRVWEYKTNPDAILGESPHIITEDIDPQEKIGREWQYFDQAVKYEGVKQYLEKDVKAEIAMKSFKNVPTGKFYPNLREIAENSKLILIEDPKSKQLIWYFAEPALENVVELREFPADFVRGFSINFPKEIKKAIEKAEKKVSG